jgi:hypothetical protein
VDEPPENPKRPTVGELLKAGVFDKRGVLGPDYGGVLGAKLNLTGLAAYQGLIGANRDLSGLIGPGLKLALGGASVADWRAKLLDAAPKVQVSVAGEMSRAIAGFRMSSLTSLAGFDPALFAKGGVGPLAGSLAALAKSLEAGLIASIKPVALLAARGLTEAMRAADERERAYQQALYDLGWWMPHSALTSFVYRVGQLAYEGDRVAVRQEMNEASHSRAFAHQVEHGWMKLPVFRERRRFLLDGLADHRRGRYRVSIPTLLPHLEGIAMAAFAPGAKDRRMKKVIAEAAAAYDALMGDALVDAVTRLWDSEGFEELGPSDRGLNRPRILHGRSTGYGTEVNSTKLLFTFDLLASLVEQAGRQRKDEDQK